MARALAVLRFSDYVLVVVCGLGVLNILPTLLGAIVGALTSLLALGIALVWRANRIINFAAGGPPVLVTRMSTGPNCSTVPRMRVGVPSGVFCAAAGRAINVISAPANSAFVVITVLPLFDRDRASRFLS